jgi:hypothetical protein
VLRQPNMTQLCRRPAAEGAMRSLPSGVVTMAFAMPGVSWGHWHLPPAKERWPPAPQNPLRR